MYSRYVFLFLGLITLCFVSVLIFTYPAIYTAFDLTGKGEIGDVIGGITAPIINLFGAALVFYSFREQIEANRIQKDALKDEMRFGREQNNMNLSMNILNGVKDDFNQLHVTKKNGDLHGSKAFKYLVDHISSEGMLPKGIVNDNLINEYRSILRILTLLIVKVVDIDMNNEDRLLILNLIHSFHNVKIEEKHSQILSKLKEISIYFENYLEHMSSAKDEISLTVSMSDIENADNYRYKMKIITSDFQQYSDKVDVMNNILTDARQFRKPNQ